MGQMYSMPAVTVLMTVHGDDGWQNGGICRDPGSWKTFIYVDDEKLKPPVPPVCQADLSCEGKDAAWHGSYTFYTVDTIIILFCST
jgi:hypothetical protein